MLSALFGGENHLACYCIASNINSSMWVKGTVVVGELSSYRFLSTYHFNRNWTPYYLFHTYIRAAYVSYRLTVLTAWNSIFSFHAYNGNGVARVPRTLAWLWWDLSSVVVSYVRSIFEPLRRSFFPVCNKLGYSQWYNSGFQSIPWTSPWYTFAPCKNFCQLPLLTVFKRIVVQSSLTLGKGIPVSLFSTVFRC